MKSVPSPLEVTQVFIPDSACEVIEQEMGTRHSMPCALILVQESEEPARWEKAACRTGSSAPDALLLVIAGIVRHNLICFFVLLLSMPCSVFSGMCGRWSGNLIFSEWI